VRRSNFNGTQTLLQLAGEIINLRAFVHVSTFYVNNFKPYNTPVKEEVHYPTLQLAGKSKTSLSAFTAAAAAGDSPCADMKTGAMACTHAQHWSWALRIWR
jgi:nucleoside-diphosphate-sugar epimerase